LSVQRALCSTIALLVFAMACNRAPEAAELLLAQEDLTAPAKIQKVQAKVSDAHRAAAREFLASGDQAFGKGRFDAAAKLYGEAALREPAPRTLLKYAMAYARGERARESKEEEKAARLVALEHARRVLDAAAALTEPASPLSAEIARERACLEEIRKGDERPSCFTDAILSGS